ncbi:glycosyl hydrolase family 5 [Pseudoroseomonas rhizosphaerae]|uniref:cellulase n=1 Tax=Teichococcus rhizosphaerae TaxID=1335062 RepID=A0A2C7AED4_9PROT|nr:glycosyl hydrolase family 8 [Pseudoroseomonas rhizosphaerae]PHK96780.1 glycosyl hydrolase family 5 [Pseudoroseomonas rhizosphaerae]
MPDDVGRRKWITLCAGLFVATPRSPERIEFRSALNLPGRQEWEDFKAKYLLPDGRIIDTGNNNASHSEGQGWALLMAEAYGDQATFNRVFAWTHRNLRRPHDSLHAWSWRPNRPQPVEDSNNATDGDLFIAWALERAARRWHRPELSGRAAAIARDLHENCVREVRGRTVLLPAAFGFEHPSYTVINPSYYVFPALDAMARLMPNDRWRELRQDGLSLLRQTGFGAWNLPADWIRLSHLSDEPPLPAPGWPARFSYDAIRIPLYLAWAGLSAEPAARAAARFWSASHPSGYTPAWAEFAQDHVAPYAADSGMDSIARLVLDPEAKVSDLPRVHAAPHYYAAALTLLARLAAFERSALT